MTGYSVTITEASKELTGKEKVMLKDFGECISLDSAVTSETGLIITPEYYAIAKVHNEKSDNKEYEKYIIVDKDGTRYVTGSQPFFSSFQDIFSDMSGDNEPWQIKVKKKESKNYKGGKFLTCSLI